ncbi:hypothetical protein, partial [Actinocorallia aurea]
LDLPAATTHLFPHLTPPPPEPPGPDAAPLTDSPRTALHIPSQEVPPHQAAGRCPFPLTAQELGNDAWPRLTARLADLADFAGPATDPAVLHLVEQRALDLARGFTRALMLREWRRAAGTARWLALSGNAPVTLRLETGIEHLVQVALARNDVVTLHHLQAARSLLNREGP